MLSSAQGPLNPLDISQTIVQYQADKGSLRRFYQIANSPERRSRFKKLDQDYLASLQKLNFNQLTPDNQVDYLLLTRDLTEEIRQYELADRESQAIQSWFPFSEPIYALEKKRRRGLAMDSQRLAQEFTDWAHQVDSVRITLDKAGPMQSRLISRAEETTKGLLQAVKSVFDFYNEYDPAFTWWMAKPYPKLSEALMALLKAFQQKNQAVTPPADGSGIIGVAVGREELIRQLQLDYIPYSPEELVKIANQEFAWCDRELLKASAEMGFGTNWKAAQEKVKNSYVPAGKQPELILRLYNESVDFLKKHDLVSIPPLAEETWRMGMMTPERQLVNPFFLGGEQILISYPTSTMAHEDKLMSMRGNNPHFSRSTVHHELIAGHHLQMFMNNRYQTHRAMFDTPFWIEGWALYWEMLLWDKGFPQSPEDKIGMLFWRMHRCARIIFSLNYHLGNWTPQQCIDFLVDRVGHERANAEGEVRRSFIGGYEPLYQLAYMTGGLQFRALRKELVESGKLTDKQFHDTILKMNELPVELIRALMTGQKLTKEFKTSWRFYDLPK
ncbi:MAG: DUF885 family protein [Siphonobacter sp.]